MEPCLLFVRKHAVVIFICALWAPSAGYGIHVLLRYSATPGKAGSPLLSWPGVSPVKPQPGHFGLVLFAHPQCPCTRATIRELAILSARTAGRLDAFVFFYYPSAQSPRWAHSDLWDDARAIPGVRVLEDRGGRWALQFGAATSGQTLLYGPRGDLRFHGGITAYRGHSGDNAGRDAIVAIVRGEQPAVSMTPVFGCSLRGD